MQHIKNSVWAEYSLQRNRINVLNGLSHQRIASTAGEKVTYFGQGEINMNVRTQANEQAVEDTHAQTNIENG